MATGSNIVKLVVQLMADAKAFAEELSKSTKAVDDAAKEMSDGLDAVAKTVTDSMSKAADEVDKGFDDATTSAKEFVDDASEALDTVVGDTADAVVDAAKEIDKGLDTAKEAVDDLSEATKDGAESMEKTVTESTRRTAEYYIDAQGRMRDAQGRLVKQGTEEFKRGMEQINKATDSVRTANEKWFQAVRTGITKTIAGLAKMREAIAQVAREVADMSARLGKSFAAAGAVVTGGMALMGREAMNFRANMAGIWAGVFDEERTQEAIREMTEGIQDLAVKYGVAVEELTEATRSAMGGGIELGESLEFLDQAAMAARAGIVGVKDIVQVTTAAMATFEKSSSEANEVLATLGKTSNWSNIEWSHLTQGIGALMPTAKMAGMTLEELGGTLAALTDRGLPPRQAMTYLNTTLDALGQPTADQAAAFEQLGIELRDVDGNARPFLDIMREIDTKLREEPNMTFFDTSKIERYEKQLETARERVASLSREMATGNPKTYAARMDKAREQVAKLEKELENVRQTGTKLDKGGVIGMLAGGNAASRRAMRVLLDDMSNVEEKIKLIGQESGGIQEQFRGFTMDNPRFELERFWQSLKVIAVILGGEVLSAFRPVAEVMANMVALTITWLRENPALARGIVAVATATSAFLAAGSSLMLVIAGIAGTVLALTTIGLPAFIAGFVILGPLVLALATAVAFVSANFDELKRWVMANWPAIRAVIVANATMIWTSVRAVATQALAAMRSIGGQFISWLQERLPDILAFVNTASQWIANKLIPAIGQFIMWFIRKVGDAFQWVKDNWPALVEMFKKYGGMMNAVWDASVEIIRLVGEALEWVFEFLGDKRTIEGATRLYEQLTSVFKTLAKWAKTVADNVRNLRNSIAAFLKDKSFGNFMKVVQAYGKFFSGNWLFGGSGGGSSSASQSFTAAGMVPMLMAGGLPVNAGGATRPGGYDPTGGNTNTNNEGQTIINATIYQRDNEPADQLITRLARELQRKRGK